MSYATNHTPYPPPVPQSPPPAQQAPPPRKRLGCLSAIIGGLVGAIVLPIILFLFIALAFAAVVGSGHMDPTETRKRKDLGKDEYPSFNEIWSAGSGETKVVRIPLRGMIALDSSAGSRLIGDSDASASTALRAIRRATLDTEVKGILLEVNSGGGTITASDIIYNALMRFRQSSTGRVVVAHFGSIAASGAYYVSLASDHIIAHPTTLTGSIGVLINSYNLRELAAKIGIEDNTIKSGANKDMLSPLVEMSDEQRNMLQQSVDEQYKIFADLVRKHRPGLSEEAVEQMDGRIFNAPHALEMGFIDSLGYNEEAEALLPELLDVPKVRIVRYEQPDSLFDLLGAPGFWGKALAKAVEHLAGQDTITTR